MEKTRVAIIGCGGIANGKHMPSLSRVEDCEMVAFCDIVEWKAVAAAKKFGTENALVYTDYKKLLSEVKPDVVHVLTPNRLHAPITIAALEAGAHVMCEKPMAATAADARAMLETARRTGKLLTIGYQNRHRPDSLFMKAECEAGTFGEIYYAKATALRRRAVPTWGVFLDEQMQGGGSLIDIGTHALDLTLWMMDNYRPKYCVGTVYHKLNSLAPADQGNAWGVWNPDGFTAEDSAFGFVVMENGATILVESSWALNTLDVREAVTTLHGTKAGADMTGGVRINGVRNGQQYVMNCSAEASGAAFNAAHGNEDPSTREARIWIEATRGNGEPLVKPEQALCVTEILEGIYESAKTGKPYYFN